MFNGHIDFIYYLLGDTTNVRSGLANMQIIKLDKYLLYLPPVNTGYFIIYQMHFVNKLPSTNRKSFRVVHRR